MKKIYKVYKLTNTLNNKVYIGYTSLTVSERIHKHYINALSGVSSNLYNSIRKNNITSFIYEEIFRTHEKKKVLEMESYYIDYYDSFKNGYNMTLGGEGGDIINQLTPEKYKKFINKVSENNKGENNSKYSGYRDDDIVEFALKCYLENDNNWIQSKWYNDYCDKFNIPKAFSKFRFNGNGYKGLKSKMIIKLKEMGHDLDVIIYKKTESHRKSLSELYKGKKWFHNDILEINRQMLESEITDDWIRGRKSKYYISNKNKNKIEC